MVDKIDVSYKYILGRLGFDKSRPWYEENVFTPELIASETIMTEKVPKIVPSLVQGGSINIQLKDRGFNSEGKESTLKPVITARIRVPLIPLKKYAHSESREEYYVYSNEQLKSSCRNFGYVVEVLKEENRIEVIDDDFDVINNHICFFEAKWSEENSLYISFYEYTGDRGILVTKAEKEEEVRPQEVVGSFSTSDEIPEGVINLFYNEQNFRNSFFKMTTDDLAKGDSIKEYELSVSKLINESFEKIPKYLDQLLVSEKSLHFNFENFNDYFQKLFSQLSSDDLNEGSKNIYLSRNSLLDIVANNEILETRFVQESPESLYFTESRAREVVDNALLSLDVKNVINAVSKEDHESIQKAIKTLENTIEKSIDSLTTDNINEGSNLYYKDSRVYNNPGFISISRLINKITYENLVSELPEESLPLTHSSLDNYATLQIIEELEEKIPISTDDLKEGQKKFFSESSVLDTLRKEFGSDVDSLLHGVLPAVNFDDVQDGMIYKKISVEKVTEIVDDRLDELNSKLSISNEIIHSQINALNTDFVPEYNNLYFTNERAYNAVSQILTTSELVESDSFLFFNKERCLSVCTSNFISTDEFSIQQNNLLSIQQNNLLSIQKNLLSIQNNFLSIHNNDLSIQNNFLSIQKNDLSIQKKDLSIQKNDLSIQKNDLSIHNKDLLSIHNKDLLSVHNSFNIVHERMDEYNQSCFLSIHNNLLSIQSINEDNILSTQNNILSTQNNILSTHNNVLHENKLQNEFNTLISEKIDEIHNSISSASSEINITNERLERVDINNHTTSELVSLLERKTEEIELWKTTLKINSESIIESEANLFFTRARSLSVHQTLYDRVQNIENNITTLKTSSATLSDDRLKSNESPILNALSVVNTLIPLTYKMIPSLDATESFDDVGFIAQDVAQIEALAHAVIPGNDTIPFSLDYHSITTFNVAALQELTDQVLTIDDQVKNTIGFTSENFRQELKSITTDDVPSGIFNKYMNLEEFKLLLQQIDTDIIPEGSLNLYHQPPIDKIITTDDVQESNSLYFTSERCESIVNDLLKTLTVEDINETDTKGFLTLSRLLRELKFVTADFIGNGITNQYLTLGNFMNLGIDTDRIAEGSNNLYLTEERVREAVEGMSIDSFTDGNQNLFCSKENVELQLNSLTTNSLPDIPGKRYLSRESFFELNISVGDILDNNTLATKNDIHQLSIAIQQNLSTSNILSVNTSNITLNTLKITQVDADVLSISDFVNQISNQINNITTDDIAQTNTHKYVSNMAMLEMQISTDFISQGTLNKYTTPESVKDILINLTSSDFPSTIQVTKDNVISTGLKANDLEGFSQSINDHLTTISSDNLHEGDNNLYFTNERVHLILDNTTTDSIQEGNANKYFSDQRFFQALSTASTNHITEGSNLYFTTDRVLETLSTASTDLLPQGISNKYLTKSNFLSIAFDVSEFNDSYNSLLTKESFLSQVSSNLTTDLITEGNKKFVSSESVLNIINEFSTDQLSEGSNLYFTTDRVLQTISTATTDSLPQGLSNKYLTKSNILSISLDVSDFTDSYNSLLTKESFLSQVSTNLTTDFIIEGDKKFVSSESVLNIINDFSTDQLSEGSNLYFTTDRVLQTLSTSSTDALPQGTFNKYLTKSNLLSIPLDVSEFNDSHNSLLTEESFLSQVSTNLTTDLITEGNKKFVSSESVLNIINHFSTDQLSEGSNLYFTTDRVLQTLSLATTDALPQGISNKYLTKSNLLSIPLDVSEFNDSYNSLLTKESFLSQVSTNLTTDLITEGTKKYVSRDSVLHIINDLSTDQLPEGNNLYFTTDRVNQIINNSFEQKFNLLFQSKTTDNIHQGSTNLYLTDTSLTQTLNTSHITGTGLTPQDIGARPISASINASEIIENSNAFFFNSTRFDNQFQTKTTDNLQEGNNLYFTPQRVIQSIQTLGNLSVSLTSESPGLLTLDITVSNDQALGATIELQMGDRHHEFQLTDFQLTQRTFTHFNPGYLTVITKLKSRYGSQVDNQTILISGNVPQIQNVSFTETEPGFSNQMNVTFAGHGNCELIIHPNNYPNNHIIQESNINLFTQNQLQIKLSSIFHSATLILKQNNTLVHSKTVTMNLGLILPMKNHFTLIGNFSFHPFSVVPFNGMNMTIKDNHLDLDGNLFHSTQTPIGAILSATESSIHYGTNKGNLKINLTHTADFVSFL
jgi:hypothetical protein